MSLLVVEAHVQPDEIRYYRISVKRELASYDLFVVDGNKRVSIRWCNLHEIGWSKGRTCCYGKVRPATRGEVDRIVGSLSFLSVQLPIIAPLLETCVRRVIMALFVSIGTWTFHPIINTIECVLSQLDFAVFNGVFIVSGVKWNGLCGIVELPFIVSFAEFERFGLRNIVVNVDTVHTQIAHAEH